jgi:hypothetical protein
MTETDNTKLTELLKVKVETASDEHLQMLSEELKRSQLLMPIEITSNFNLDENLKEGDVFQPDEPLRFKPISLTDDFGNELIPLFSDESQVQGKVSVIGMYTPDLADSFAGGYDESIDGVAFNPFSENPIMLPMETFIRMFKSE